MELNILDATGDVRFLVVPEVGAWDYTHGDRGGQGVEFWDEKPQSGVAAGLVVVMGCELVAVVERGVGAVERGNSVGIWGGSVEVPCCGAKGTRFADVHVDGFGCPGDCFQCEEVGG